MTDEGTSSALIQTGSNRLIVANNIVSTVFPGIATSTPAQITGNIALTAPNALAGATRTLTVADSPAANDLTITANIVDGSPFASGITKAGTGWGRLVLNPTVGNTYSGLTTVTNGVVTAQSNTALGLGLLGAASAGTTVGGAGALELSGGITITDENITSNSFGYYDQNPTRFGNAPIGGGGIRSVSGNNTIQSSITNQAGTLVTLSAANNSVGVDTGSTLTINAVVNETQQTFKTGQGVLVLGGATSNTGAGATLIQDGILRLNKLGSANALNSTVTVGDNGSSGGNTDVLQFGPNAGNFQVASGTTVIVQSTGKLDLATYNRTETIGALQLIKGILNSADVEIGNGQLSLTSTLTSAAMGAPIGATELPNVINAGTSGLLNIPANQTFQVNRGFGLSDLVVNAPMVTPDNATITKTYPGVWVVNNNQPYYTGPTIVNDGFLEVDGTGFGGAVTVNAGGTLTGSGTISGIVTANALSAQDAVAGIVAPGPTFGEATGLSTGILGGGLASLGNGIFTVQITGTVAGTQYDQLGAFGANVTGGNLNISLPSGFVPPVGAQYILLNNTSADPITGVFGSFQGVPVTGGLVQGSVLTINGYQFTLSYTGGANGNSIVLTRTGSAAITETDTNTATTAVPGTTTTFTVVVTNNNTSGTIAHLQLADAIPAGVSSDTYTSTQTGGVTNNTASGSGAIADNNLDVPPLASVTYTIVDTIASASTGTVVNSATVTALNGLTITGVTTATSTVTLTPQSDLSVTNVVNPSSSVSPGTNVTYTIVAANSGPSDVIGATIVDSLPSQLTSDTFTVTTTGGASDTTNASSGSGNISDTLNMPSGSTITYKIVGAVSAGTTGSFNDTATISSPASGNTDPNGANNTATSTVSTLPTADLGITMTDNSGGTEIPGNTYTYTVTVSNTGPNPVTGGKVVSDFGTKLTGVSYSVTGTTNGGTDTTHTSGTGNINDNVNLPLNATITYSVVGTVLSTATGSLTTTATVSAPSGITDPNTSNNVATDTETLGNASQADLQITNSENATSYAAGTNVTYTIVASNAGPGNVTGASIADTFPATLTGVAYTVTTTGGASDTTHASGGTGNLGESVNLPSGSTITYVVTGSLPSSTAAGSLSDTATITAPGGVTDPNTANNTATASATITNVADLAVTNTSSPATVNAGGAVSYTVVVNNTGPSNVTGATVTDTFPGTLTGITYTVTANGGAADTTHPASGSGNLAETVNLPSGGSLTYVVSGTVNAGAASGTLTTTASVTAPSGSSDPNTSNNVASTSQTINGASAASADLSITNVPSSTSVSAGATVTYTVIVHNGGASAVTGATVTDTFPSGLTGVSYTVTTSGGAADTTHPSSGTGNLNETVNLPNGSNITYVVTGTAPASSTTLTDTAIVSPPSGTSDPNFNNNVASNSVSVGASNPASIDLTAVIGDDQGGTVSGSNSTGFTASGGTTSVGTVVNYTIVVTNNDPTNTVSGVSVVDVLPTNAGFTGPAAGGTISFTASTTGGVTGFTAASTDPNTVGIDDTNLTFGPGASVTYVLSGTVDASASNFITDTASVSPPSGTTDSNLADNSTNDTLALPAAVSVAIVPGSTVNAGGVLSYDVVVTNDGSVGVNGVTINFPVPSSSQVNPKTFQWSASDNTLGYSNSGSGQNSTSDTINIPSGDQYDYSISVNTLSSDTGSITLSGDNSVNPSA